MMWMPVEVGTVKRNQQSARPPCIVREQPRRREERSRERGVGPLRVAWRPDPHPQLQQFATLSTHRSGPRNQVELFLLAHLFGKGLERLLASPRFHGRHVGLFVEFLGPNLKSLFGFRIVTAGDRCDIVCGRRPQSCEVSPSDRVRMLNSGTTLSFAAT